MLLKIQSFALGACFFLSIRNSQDIFFKQNMLQHFETFIYLMNDLNSTHYEFRWRTRSLYREMCTNDFCME